MKPLLSFFLVAGMALVTACNQNQANHLPKETVPPLVDATIPGSFSSQQEKHFDSTAIPVFFDSFPNLQTVAGDLYKFYQNRAYAYAWYDSQGMIEQAGNLFNRVKNIDEEGLSGRTIYLDAFSKLMENGSAGKKERSEVVTELMLTAQYLYYARNVWEGLDEKQSLALEWLLPRKKISTTRLLDSLLSGKDVLENAPVFRQYYLLKEHLKKYRAIQPLDTVKIRYDGKGLKPGDSSAVVRKVKEKLFLYGDLPVNDRTNLFDAGLKKGIQSFQQRSGLKETGMIDKKVIAELNIPVEARIRQIIINMERSRWVPQEPSTNYLVINVPEYKMHVYENDSLVWDMNVVVGEDQHKTVVFNGTMKYIVFSPYWNIPAGIMKNETLPAIRRNPNYLAKHNMEWFGGKIRQRPGPNNSLGLVKFLFPNSHSIYLHDTPAKSLFNETDRAFSHGCIRLAEAKKLARYLLRDDPAWNLVKIDSAMNSGKEQYVSLKRPIPVFISYFTSWVSRSGKLNFRKDVYKRDARLEEMLFSDN